ncbi:hypothetical protein SFIMM107S_05510 [Streptomyces griseus]
MWARVNRGPLSETDNSANHGIRWLSMNLV